MSDKPAQPAQPVQPTQSTRRTLGEVSEREVIQAITDAAPSVINGDDAAVLFPGQPNSRTVVATDTLVEGRHFRLDWSSPEEVGQKAILQNFADIEAMGARPTAALLSLSAPPETPLEVVRGIAAGIGTRARRYTAELVGGDVTKSNQLIVTITAVGSLGGSRSPLTLDRARAGQQLVAHGRLGWSAAGLALLERFGRAGIPRELTSLVDAHCAPWLSPNRGMIARAAGASAMTDNSDGLLRELQLLCQRSGVGIDLDSAALAPDDLLVHAGQVLGVDPWDWVLGGGEDHTLLATTAKSAPSGFRRIGDITAGTKSAQHNVCMDATPIQLSAANQGWESFQ